MFFPPVDNWMFTLVPVFILIVFAVVLGTIVFTLIKKIGEWDRNNRSPVLTVNAKVVTKRMAVTHHHAHHHHGHYQRHHVHHHHPTSTTRYHATFEFEGGDRMEFNVPDREYGLLAEGDAGRLTFQGTRYKGFERARA